MVKGPVKWILYAAAAVLILLGILFVIASYANTSQQCDTAYAGIGGFHRFRNRCNDLLRTD